MPLPVLQVVRSLWPRWFPTGCYLDYSYLTTVHTLLHFFFASFYKTRPEFLRVHVPIIPYTDTCVLVFIYLCMHSSYMMRPDFYVKGQDLCGIRIVRCTVIKSVPIV